MKSNIFKKIKSMLDQIMSSKTIKDILKVYGGDIVTKILAALSTIILIRTLDQHDYAHYVSFSAVASIFISFVGSGINGALIRFSAEQINKTGQKPLRLYLISLIVQIGIMIFSALVIFLFPHQAALLFFGKSDLSSILIVSVVFGLGNILFFWGQSVLKSEERFNDYIKTLWVKQITVIVIILILIFSNLINFYWVSWSISFSQLALGIGVVLYCFKNENKRSGLFAPSINDPSMSDFFKASSWLIGYGIAVGIFSQLDKLLLTRFSTTSELSNYGVAFQYYSMAILLLGSISAVLIPKFSKLEMQNPVAQKEFLNKWTKTLVWLIIPIVLLIIVAKPLYVLINGSQYSNSYTMFSILAIGVWLSLLLSPLTNILMSRKEFRYLFILSLIALVLSFPIFYFSITLLGGIGAAIGVIAVHNVILQLPILWRVIKQ
ncbi:MAG: hypothetical protein CVU42_11925 [Chloroflexi bacterium HGW-Chloroflexi-4]|jgi:O-antigen/teichoic acid export membrane protein|nr:MAG: hypothetical protein CVU42_11925 [Chloroflexi bacterium HGW-Chloroflexi-4]